MKIKTIKIVNTDIEFEIEVPDFYADSDTIAYAKLQAEFLTGISRLEVEVEIV